MVFHTDFGKCVKRMAGGCARGFTLIELLVVMAIVALLLTVALPRYFGSLQHAKEIALRENLQVLRGTLDKFYGDKGRYPSSLDELVELKYLRAVPVDPITESSKTWRSVGLDVTTPEPANVYSGAAGGGSDGTPYAEY